MQIFTESDVKNKRIICRFDFDVPVLDDGKIADTNRIDAAIPTISRLLQQNVEQILILAHRGKPVGVDATLTMQEVANYLAQKLSDNPSATSEIVQQDAINNLGVYGIFPKVYLLENIRFDAGEEKNDPKLAAEIARHGDVFIFDAFATAHREHASTVGVSALLPHFSGLHLAQEIQYLSNIKDNPNQPLMFIIGGAKIEDKLPIIEKLAPLADQFLIGGAVANTFLKSRNIDVKRSLVDPDFITQANDIFERYEDKIMLPTDYAWDRDSICDIGPETIMQFEDALADAKTVFWNGNLGRTEDPRFSRGTLMIADVLARSPQITRVIAGGDTVGFLNQHQLADKMTFVSTGGGASLDYLAGKSLPALTILDE
ncbi:MAG: phosphoglycerate kinase [Patescibacteria group bacterium]|jgi:phosphoglycerate kinase